MIKITKEQAIKLVGVDEVERVVSQRDTSLLLPSGCKLFAKTRGCVTRFGIYGYAHDGKDVQQVLTQLRG